MIVRSKAPLRLGLAGGGTDVSPYSDQFGGYVLNATIDMYAYCTIEVTNTDKIEIRAADQDLSFESPAVDHLEINGALDLHKGVYNRIVKEFNGGDPLGFKMTTYSDALAGSGLGSSSTMVVAILSAFVEWLNLPLGEYDIASLAYEIERKDIGLSGGKQDQYAATFGGFNFMEFYENDRVIVNPLRIKSWILDELETSMVLYFTGVSRESAKIIDEQARNVVENKKKSIDAMHQLKADALVMKEALLKGEIQRFAKHLNKSWEAKKKMAHTITNQAIDEIYQAALDAGAISGKISGAGGGGFMMLFVDPTKKVNVINELGKFPGKVFKCHFTKHGSVGWTIH
ncbi:dehydrogenase [candidate division KSB1 bacterium]|nr:dehydrogenase [candidate division KSB1 bacterium]